MLLAAAFARKEDAAGVTYDPGASPPASNDPTGND
jgi:hypothetical protein